LDASDKIEVKYRTVQLQPLEITAEWTSTSTFITGSDLSAYSIGDEVEVTEGAGGGQIEHITNIVEVSGVWTVALSNPVVGAVSLSLVRLQKWKQSIQTNPNNLYVREFPIANAESSWIQIKCVMYFTGQDEVNTLLLANKTQLPTV